MWGDVHASRTPLIRLRSIPEHAGKLWPRSRHEVTARSRRHYGGGGPALAKRKLLPYQRTQRRPRPQSAAGRSKHAQTALPAHSARSRPRQPATADIDKKRPNPAKMTAISEIRPHRSRLSAVFDRLGLIIPRISIKHSGGGTRQQSRFRRKEGSAKSGDQTTIVLRGSGY